MGWRRKKRRRKGSPVPAPCPALSGAGDTEQRRMSLPLPDPWFPTKWSHLGAGLQPVQCQQGVSKSRDPHCVSSQPFLRTRPPPGRGHSPGRWKGPNQAPGVGPAPFTQGMGRGKAATWAPGDGRATNCSRTRGRWLRFLPFFCFQWPQSSGGAVLPLPTHPPAPLQGLEHPLGPGKEGAAPTQGEQLGAEMGGGWRWRELGTRMGMRTGMGTEIGAGGGQGWEWGQR